MAGKIGEGILSAYGRQGLAEVRQAVSLGSPIEQSTDYGMVGMATAGEIAQERNGQEIEGDKHSTLQSREAEAGQRREDPGRDEPGKEGPDMDR